MRPLRLRLALTSCVIAAGILTWSTSRRSESPTTSVEQAERPSMTKSAMGAPQLQAPLPRIPVEEPTRPVASVSSPSSSVDVPLTAQEWAAMTPLQRILYPQFERQYRESIETVRASIGDPRARARAARSLMTKYVAVRMEQAGTALDASRPGDPRRDLPARQQFSINARIYCFDEGEFPLFDRAKRAEAMDPAEAEQLFLEVAEMGEEVIRMMHDGTAR